MNKTYTTIQGDMWDMIAKRKLGSELHMHRLLELNQEYHHMAVFPAGITLRLPKIEPKTAKRLPPWKR